MIKKTILSLTTLVLLTACGGSSSASETDTEKLSKKDVILIAYNYPANVCKSKELLESLRSDEGTKNYLLVVASNSVTCGTYGKDSSNCETQDLEGAGNESCVIGFDFTSSSKQLKSSMSGQIEDIKNSMIIAAD